MGKEKACLIVHPKAGKHIDSILAALEERWETAVIETQFAGHGIELAADAPRQGYRWLIAYGGDGMLNEVINGAMRTEQPCVVGTLHGGTVNQWAREIGLPTHPVEAAQTLTRSIPRQIDLGHVSVSELEFPDQKTEVNNPENGPLNGLYFLLVAGLGMDAMTIQKTSESSKQQFGQLAFMIDWLRILPEMRSFPIQIHWSDGQSWEGQSWDILVSNTRCYTIFENLIPEAYVNDGLLDIRVFALSSPVQGLLRPYHNGNFSLKLPASVLLQLDGSGVELSNFVSTENLKRIQQAEDVSKVFITYVFQAKPAALSMAIPPEYTGALFK